MHKTNNLKLDYLRNSIKIVLKHENLTNYEIKDNIINITSSDGDINIEYEITDSGNYKYSIQHPAGIQSVEARELQQVISSLAAAYCFKFVHGLYLSYYPSHQLAKINMCNYTIELCISNIIIYLEKVGIEVFKYEIFENNTLVNIHTKLYNILHFRIIHIDDCVGHCMVRGSLCIFNGTCFTEFRFLCCNDIFSCQLFHQLGIDLQNNKAKCLKILMLARELVKEYLCTDLFNDMVIVIYRSLFGEKCVTGFDYKIDLLT